MSRPIDADGTCRYSTGRPGPGERPSGRGLTHDADQTRQQRRAAAPIASRRGNSLPRRETCQQASFLLPHSLSGPTVWVGLHALLPSFSASRFLARIVAERAGLDVRISASHSDPHRCRTAQLCLRSQPHLAGWTLIGVGPNGLRAAAGPAQLGCGSPHVNVPTSGRSPVRYIPGVAGRQSRWAARARHRMADKNSSADNCRRRRPLRRYGPVAGRPV